MKSVMVAPIGEPIRLSSSDGPLVSVIIIFLNAEKFLDEAIESVFAQTYHNWELLLVDDGSTDASTRLALQYAKEYPTKVRYFQHDKHQNRGMSASRNLGIRHAGEYIAFLDADDVWLPGKLNEQMAILRSHPEAAMVYGPVQRWFSWSGKPEDTERDCVSNLGFSNTLVRPPSLLAGLLQKEGATAIGGVLRRDAVEAVGCFEESFHGMYEDQAFFAKLCVHAPIFVTTNCSYRWRKHPDSCCSVAVMQGKYHSARLTFLAWLETYLSGHAVEDRGIWTALRKELRPYRHPWVDRLSKNISRCHERFQELKDTLRRTLPLPVVRWLRIRRHGHEHPPPVGEVRFGDLRRTVPVSRVWGFDRGLPIDRYYIERFISDHASEVHGRVLEVQDDTYTRKFGGKRVSESSVLHVEEGNPKATIVADLTRCDQIPSDSYDCIILSQTLQFIYDVRAAIKTLYRILKPGGTLLVTVPGISQISRHDMERWGDYWRFTSLSSKKLFEEVFPSRQITVKAYGNVCAASAFLHGLAAEEFAPEELDHSDPDYEVLITITAVKRRT